MRENEQTKECQFYNIFFAYRIPLCRSSSMCPASCGGILEISFGTADAAPGLENNSRVRIYAFAFMKRNVSRLEGEELLTAIEVGDVCGE